MVALDIIHASNRLIASELPSGLVAVFVGGTNGIGEATLKAFARHAKSPRIYNIGRSEEAGERIGNECKSVNPDVEYTFIKTDLSLMKNVDEVCLRLKRELSSINLLVLSTGSLDFSRETSDGLLYAVALVFYGRTRFMSNLLPLLASAKGLRRVVQVFAGTKEGEVNTNDFEGRTIKNPLTARGHAASIVTLTCEAMAVKAPGVSFIHVFPGPVKGGVGRGVTGIMAVFVAVFNILGPLFNMNIEECGERHLFLATSGRYPAAHTDMIETNGVPVQNAGNIAMSVDGKEGGGVYAVDALDESAGPKVVELFREFRENGLQDTVMDHIEGTIRRITGSDGV